MIEFVNKVSVWVYTYDLGRREGSVDTSAMWGTVVHTLLEASGWIYSGLVTGTDPLMGFERVVIHEINTEHISDALGIRSVGEDP